MMMKSILLMMTKSVLGKEWISVSEMPLRLSDMTATKIGVTSVLVVGGCDDHQLSCDDYEGCTFCPSISDRALEYSSSDDRWRELATSPRPRYRHAAAYYADAVYVVGGRHADDAVVVEVDVYSIKTNSWRTMSSTVGVGKSDLAAFVYGGILYAYGGYDADYEAQSGAIAIDVVSESYSSTSLPPLIEARGDFGIVVDETTAYAAGGWSHLDWCSPLDTVESLDLSDASNGWRSEPSLAVARGDKALALVDETLVVVGGEHNNGCSTASTPVDDVEVLRGDKWKPVADAPEPKFRGAAVGLDGRLFFFGGQAAIETTCPGEAEFCFPVTNHTWVFDADQDDGDNDDDNGDSLSDEVVIAIVACALALAIVLCVACIFGKCISCGKKKSAQNNSDIMLQKSDNTSTAETKTAV